MNKLVAGLVIVPAWLCVGLLSYQVSVLKSIYHDIELTARQSVITANAIVNLPNNFRNSQ